MNDSTDISDQKLDSILEDVKKLTPEEMARPMSTRLKLGLSIDEDDDAEADVDLSAPLELQELDQEGPLEEVD